MKAKLVVLQKLSIGASISIALAACATGGNGADEYDAVYRALDVPRIYATEPSDQTMSCEELTGKIKGMDRKVALFDKARTTIRSDMAVDIADGSNEFKNLSTADPASQEYASYQSGIDALNKWSATHQAEEDVENQRDLQLLDAQFYAAQQRRVALTQIHNQRCF